MKLQFDKLYNILIFSYLLYKVSEEALDKRHKQGWIQKKVTTVEGCVNMIRDARRNQSSLSIGYLGK